MSSSTLSITSNAALATASAALAAFAMYQWRSSMLSDKPTPSARNNDVPFNLPDHASTEDDMKRTEYPLRPLHVVLATTGSVASIKAPLIVKELLRVRHVVAE